MREMHATLPATWRLGHRPALDGLRGVAVLLVLFGHARIPGFDRAGNIGVTLFFVLSGFLITALLLEEHDRSGGVNLPAFYLRRARRLLPALALLVVFVSIAMAASGQASAIIGDVGPTLFYFGNWVQATGGSLGYLDHTWSLSVEEQFYLVWPLLLIGLLALSGRRRWPALAVVLALAIGSMVLRASFAVDFAGNDARTDVRADALMIGCALAILAVTGRLPAVRSAVALVAVAILAIVLPQTSAPFMMLAGYTVIALAGAVLVVAALEPRRILTWRPLRGLGRISYGVYLWHFPLMIELRPQLDSLPLLPKLALAAALMALSIGAAALSWYVVESRFLRRSTPAHRPARLAHQPVVHVAGQP